MIKVTDLSKSYGAVQAVRDVNLEIRKGEIVGLLGRNGAGKTTIMKMLTGYLEPSAGRIELAGLDVVTDRTAVQRRLGYMPENAPLYPEMLVQEYLMMVAALRDIPLEKQREMVLEAVKATGIENYLTRPIGTLSKGYRQRVGICQAIVPKPEVLILDEPTNGLDPVQIVEIRHLIKSLAKTATVILSTHILQEIEAVCDRVLILIDGALVKDAPLSEFLTSSHVTISLEEKATAAELATVTSAIDGLGTPEAVGNDSQNSGYRLWSIPFKGDKAPVADLVRAVTAKGWNTAQVTAAPPSLEKAFASLMTEHGRRTDKEKAA